MNLSYNAALLRCVPRFRSLHRLSEIKRQPPTPGGPPAACLGTGSRLAPLTAVHAPPGGVSASRLPTGQISRAAELGTGEWQLGAGDGAFEHDFAAEAVEL